MANYGVGATESSNRGPVGGGTDYAPSNNNNQQGPKWKKELIYNGMFDVAEKYPNINLNSLEGASVFG